MWLVRNAVDKNDTYFSICPPSQARLLARPLCSFIDLNFAQMVIYGKCDNLKHFGENFTILEIYYQLVFY